MRAGSICLTGGAEGPLGHADPRGPCPQRARALAERLAAALPGPALRRDPAPSRRTARRARPVEEATEPGLVDARLRPRPAAGRHQRRACSPTRGHVRRARRAALHRRGRLRRPAGAAPPADARASLQVAGRDGRRSSPTCRRRWRTRSRSPAAAPVRPKKRKPILPRFAEDEVEELRRQAREGLDGAARGDPARPRPSRGLPRAAGVRARRHRGDGLPRLLPDRRRLHQVGEGARHPGRARPRLGGGQRSSPTR